MAPKIMLHKIMLVMVLELNNNDSKLFFKQALLEIDPLPTRVASILEPRR